MTLIFGMDSGSAGESTSLVVLLFDSQRSYRWEEVISQESTASVSAKLEYPACLVCGSDQREFPFRLHDPYSIARCTACGFYYLYPRIIEGAMQEAYRQPSYYEGGACGSPDTSYANRNLRCAQRSNACCIILPTAD